MDSIFVEIKKYLQDINGKLSKLGYPEKGTTGYYSANMTEQEVQMVDKVLTTLNIDLLNTRIMKVEDNHYKVLIASVVIKN